MRCGDPDWTSRVHAAFRTVLAEAGDEAFGLDFSVSEQYDHAPADLAPAQGPLGWTCRIVDGIVVSFETTPHSGVDISLRVDYPVFDELAQLLIEGDPERVAAFEARCASAIDDGRMTVQGDPAAGRPWLMWGVHDEMARAMISANISQPQRSDEPTIDSAGTAGACGEPSAWRAGLGPRNGPDERSARS